jgi:hypothetical protein
MKKLRPIPPPPLLQKLHGLVNACGGVAGLRRGRGSPPNCREKCGPLPAFAARLWLYGEGAARAPAQYRVSAHVLRTTTSDIQCKIGYDGRPPNEERAMATKSIEKRVSDLEAMVDDVPRLINVRFAFVRAQIEALDAKVGTVDAKVERLESTLGARLSSLDAKVDALPQLLADMMDERAKRGG